MKKQLTITTHAELAKQDHAYWRACTPEQRLDAVEVLRLEAGKFLYEYPSCAGDGGFRELFQLLENHHVDYMVIGGYAVAFHDYPRFTHDLDIFFDASSANVTRLRGALIHFGFAEQDLPEQAFTAKGNILTFGVAPTRVDLLNEIDGVLYAEAKPNVVRGFYGDVQVSFIGRDDLIANKLATQRAQDKADAEQLRTPPE